MKVSKLPKVRKIGAIPKIGEAAELPKIPSSKIVARPRARTEREDLLEKSALQEVAASLPERIVWKWLEIHHYLYETERAELGGRDIVGGAIVDFKVYGLTDKPIVFRVQGSYWHSAKIAGVRARDDAQAGRLRAQGYLVVDLWEQDIYRAVLGHYLDRYIWNEILR